MVKRAKQFLALSCIVGLFLGISQTNVIAESYGSLDRLSEISYIVDKARNVLQQDYSSEKMFVKSSTRLILDAFKTFYRTKKKNFKTKEGLLGLMEKYPEHFSDEMAFLEEDMERDRLILSIELPTIVEPGLRNQINEALLEIKNSLDAKAKIIDLLKDKYEKIKEDLQAIKKHTSLGISYSKEGAWEKAISEFLAALEMIPEDGPTHHNLALAYYSNKHYKLAIEHCDAALELGEKVQPELLELLKPYR